MHSCNPSTKLFSESEISEALDLLHSSLDKPDGFEQVVDCVAAWQDLIDSSDSALRPLLECLDDDEPAVILGALRVVNALIHKAPDEARAFRIKNELSGISTLKYQVTIFHRKKKIC
ncbi:unnamed protein product [Strongylus vulgaris]|uniref:Uncharacterized protein n=1 Tax=Strongylus vulgaris TaxID=40348 RepID=A0A3P7J8R4_STRVU|nr:unnamed protein product [Strongylus vulgaris]